ncbi:hypothetical protein SDC9_102877 [bioreactor metagenome]|uniref:CDP-diacylglycerol--glycerol-3-phosphate 3-phosphatidyltransferase n=1 Tax=bioreactor metagenome TaxID=1076179 RepID=A0A645ATI9_9ZZZZ
MRRLPNILTAMRIMLAAPLLLLPLTSGAFFALYLLCGATDVLDGWLARRLHAVSPFGARLDSFADLAVIAILLWRLYPVLSPGTGALMWTGAIAALRFGAALTAKVRYGRFGFLHTAGNKLTGFMLFFYPLTFFLTRSGAFLYLLLTVATLSAMEELVIELTAVAWDPDRKSIFS